MTEPPSTNPPAPARKRRHPLLSGVVVLAVIALAVFVASLVFVPYGSKSQLMWHEFRQQENLDMVCIGSSLSERAFDPSVIDPLCGTTSFNMCTPSQFTAESYIGLREALEHHQITRVIFGVDFSNFLTPATLYPGRVYLQEKWKSELPTEWFADMAYAFDNADWFFNEKSLNWLFPWTEQQPKSGISGLLENVKMRLDGTTLAYAAMVNEPGWIYYGMGYGNYENAYEYNKSDQDDIVKHYNLANKPIDQANVDHLSNIAKLCADNGVEFIAVAPALPEFSLISLKAKYDPVSDAIREAVESQGGSYYDFNLATPDLYQSQPSHFADYQHYNVDGGRAFSKAFAKLLLARDAGEDTSKWFVSYTEKLASIDHISTVQFSEKQIEGGKRITAKCFAGTNVKVEYQFQVKKNGEENFTTVRDWNKSATFDFKPQSSGTYVVRVNARQQGTKVAFERYTQHSVSL